jgi:hypothetical protein
MNKFIIEMNKLKKKKNYMNACKYGYLLVAQYMMIRFDISNIQK